MAMKRVILANGSRLIREVLHHVLDKAERLEVIQEIVNPDELSSAIERFGPEWVIVSLPFNHGGTTWIDTCMAQHPAVRFVLLSLEKSSIKMKWQASYEEDLTNLSLEDFIHILEKDLQHT
jgi:chemotaxis response regulator CheB